MTTSAQFFRRTLDSSEACVFPAWGVLLLRVTTGLLIFYIHGWHKVHEGIVYLREGASWRLVEEIAEMGMPAPVLAAFAATAVQLVSAPLLAIGLFTRLNAALLAAVLAGAVAQNLMAARDSQLAILYALNVAVFVLLGGGRFSADAKLFGHPRRQHA